MDEAIPEGIGEIVRVVDTFGLLCPIPVIKAGAALKNTETGAVIELISTDPGVVKDMRDWCRANGHDYLGDAAEGRVIKVWVRKG